LLNLTNAPEGFLDPVARVVEAALAVTEGLSAREVMVVGAGCRDILHSALGHSFATAATRDLDLALALTSWDAYRTLAAAFPGSVTPESGSGSPMSTSTYCRSAR